MSESGSLIRSILGRPAARNYHTFVINEIGLGIVTGELPIGSILPNDAQMMERYGVSRTVLREALRTLEAKGMVEARPKVGTRVAPSTRWNLFDQQVLAWHFAAAPDQGFYANLFDVRLSLENLAVQLASGSRTAEHVRMLKYWVHQMEQATDSTELHALAQLEVHRIIADASGNALLRSSMGLIELTIALASVGEREDDRAGSRAAILEVHHELVAAIEAGDAQGAAAATGKLIELGRTAAGSVFAPQAPV